MLRSFRKENVRTLAHLKDYVERHRGNSAGSLPERQQGRSSAAAEPFIVPASTAEDRAQSAAVRARKRDKSLARASLNRDLPIAFVICATRGR